MAIVDFLWYTTTFHGTAATECEFAQLEARAEDLISSMTRWTVTESTIADFPEMTQTLVKKAICAQVDFFALNGLETLTGGGSVGFTVGKVTVQGNATAAAGKAFISVSPLAVLYLEQTGLLAPQVETAPDMPQGWWG